MTFYLFLLINLYYAYLFVFDSIVLYTLTPAWL